METAAPSRPEALSGPGSLEVEAPSGSTPGKANEMDEDETTEPKAEEAPSTTTDAAGAARGKAGPLPDADSCSASAAGAAREETGAFQGPDVASVEAHSSRAPGGTSYQTRRATTRQEGLPHLETTGPPPATADENKDVSDANCGPMVSFGPTGPAYRQASTHTGLEARRKQQQRAI